MRILYAHTLLSLSHTNLLWNIRPVSCRLLQIIGSWGSLGCKSLGSSSGMVSCIWGKDLIFRKNQFYMISCWYVDSFKVWAWHFESKRGVWRGWLFHANLSPLWVALVTDAASGIHTEIFKWALFNLEIGHMCSHLFDNLGGHIKIRYLFLWESWKFIIELLAFHQPLDEYCPGWVPTEQAGDWLIHSDGFLLVHYFPLTMHSKYWLG